MKKFKGVEHRLGSDWEQARALAAAMIAGMSSPRPPRELVATLTTASGATVRSIVDACFAHKLDEWKAGACSPATVKAYRTQLTRFARIVRADRLVESLEPGDFARVRSEASRRGVGATLKTVTHVRAMFAWAEKQGLIDRPPRYGGAFQKPRAIELRRMRNRRKAEQGEAAWSPEELRTLIARTNPVLKAAILLALNGGFSNADIAGLEDGHIDFDGGVIDFARPKTEIPRRVPLWPETVAAMRIAREKRPRPALRADARRVFLTEEGNPVARYSVRQDTKGIRGAARIDRLSQWFKLACKSLGLWQPGRGFASLRAAFRSLAVGQPRELVELLMGHTLPGLDPFYVRGMQPKLVEVTDHVRRALFGSVADRAGGDSVTAGRSDKAGSTSR